MNKFTIITDSREQQPFDFPPSEFCNGSVTKTLKTGDYSLLNAEHLLCIERKKNCSEIWSNLAKQWKRFSAELERMSEFEFPILICEFPYKHVLEFPVGSGIPRRYWGRLFCKRAFLRKRIYQIRDDYGIEVIFADDRTNAKRILQEVFRATHLFMNRSPFVLPENLYKSLSEYEQDKDIQPGTDS